MFLVLRGTTFIYKFIFVWIYQNVLFGKLFCSGSTRIADDKVTPNPSFAQWSLQNFWHRSDKSINFRQLTHISSSYIYSLTIQLHHVKISTKTNKTKIFITIFFVTTWLSNRTKTWTRHCTTFRSKKSRITTWELKIEWEHFKLFQTFLSWFRRKNDLDGIQKRTN